MCPERGKKAIHLSRHVGKRRGRDTWEQRSDKHMVDRETHREEQRERGVVTGH